jgi:hypothetical protein
MSKSFNRTPSVYAKDSICITLPDHQNGHYRTFTLWQSKTSRLPGFIMMLTLFAVAFLFDVNTSKAQSAIYGGGPVYKNRSYSINELKNSGFTHVIVWTIHIDASGNFNFNAEFPLVSNGAYVGGSSYPNFASDIASLKTGNTSINRVEFCLSAWASSTFANIRNLINAQGTGSSSILYRNFKALRNTFPAVDAIGFDDESTYDVNSSTALAVMLGNLGFKVSLVPYTNAGYWTSVANNTNNQRPGTIDRVDLQCYAGGASNNPCSWNFGSIPVFPGLWDAEKSTSQVQSQLTTWKNNCAAKGGFIWLYDDIDNSAATAQYATAIRNVFGGGVVSNRVAVVHKDCNYTGSVIGLPLGDYTLTQLIARGVLNDDLSSLQVSSGYRVVLYEHDNFTGASLTVTANNSCLVGAGWNDRASSLRVQSNTGAFTQTIQAESYSTMLGVQTETTTDAGGGLNVGWIDNTDWMAYNSITLPTSGTYLVEYRVASPNTTAVLSLDLNGGAIQLGSLAVPNTGGWQNWTTISHTVNINAGTYNVGIFAQTGGFNLNWWRITKTATGRVDVQEEKLSEHESDLVILYPNPAVDQLHVKISEAFEGGELSIMNVAGKESVRTRAETRVLNIAHLPAGLHIMTVYKEGRRVVQRFIKQ